jgi:hypothetical protein
MFGNTGNYGLPLVSFAFGESALQYGACCDHFHPFQHGWNPRPTRAASLKDALLGLLKVFRAMLINVLTSIFPLRSRVHRLAAEGASR